MPTEKSSSRDLPRRPELGTSSDRRAEAVAAAIEVLSNRGARGLTHRELDRYLEWPVGSTSNYFRRRNDILIAIAERIIQQDLEDLSILEKADGKSGELSVELLSERIVRLLKLWMRPAQRSRAFARAEILFESTRNTELRATTQAQIALTEGLLCRIFAQLGSSSPLASAKLCGLLASSLHVTALLSKGAPTSDQLHALVHSWILVCIEDRGPEMLARKSAASPKLHFLNSSIRETSPAPRRRLPKTK